MRGIRYGFVATTLLAQVDAAIGGKNGVNFQGYKNIIGVFNQPEFVICDVSLLKTLAKDDVLCGLAEIIKHALLADKEMFSILENKKEDILALKDEVIEELVYRSVKIKSAVVNEDEREQGKRKLLNLGHTIGHAVEKTYSVSHGKAVAIGIRYAVQLSVNKNYLDKQVAERIISLLDTYNFSDLKVDESKIFSAILKDKKKTGTFLSFIFLRNIGEPIIEEVTFEELKEDIYELS
jgi:3-dehydroquinate synthase